jgi:hypothetical protein
MAKGIQCRRVISGGKTLKRLCFIESLLFFCCFLPSEPHCVGARHLLCSGHSFELEIRLHYPHRFLNHDHNVFDCCGMAFSEEASLKPLIVRCSELYFFWVALA